jgi:hypothetical protein
METSMERARVGLASAKARHGLTEAKLRDLQPSERAYKVSDGGNGLYVVVTPSGSRSFRYDYRLSGRRETLTIGRHEPVARHAQRSHLAYGMDVTLEEARLLLARARVDVSSGRSPARAKVELRSEVPLRQTSCRPSFSRMIRVAATPNEKKTTFTRVHRTGAVQGPRAWFADRAIGSC